MKYIIDKSDGKTENHPYFKDLVSSLSVFNNQKKSDIELEEGDTLPDDSDFTFLKNVEDYLKIWIENPTKEILVDCLVPDEYIFSSNSAHKDGYDRVKKIDYDACKRWVRTKENGKPLIMATENLETMIFRETPSKSEVISIANSIEIGSDCIMLSEETATSKNCLKKMPSNPFSSL